MEDLNLEDLNTELEELFDLEGSDNFTEKQAVKLQALRELDFELNGLARALETTIVFPKDNFVNSLKTWVTENNEVQEDSIVYEFINWQELANNELSKKCKDSSKLWKSLTFDGAEYYYQIGGEELKKKLVERYYYRRNKYGYGGCWVWGNMY